MPERRHFTQITPLEERLDGEAKRLRKQAQGTPPGIERERLIRRARQVETASQMTELLNSRGVQASGKMGSSKMAIHRLLQNITLEPDAVGRVTAAYEQALHTLCVKDRDDPLTEMIAKTIIRIAQSGVRDPAQISAQAIRELEVR